MLGDSLLRVSLSTDSHFSLAMSCADRLLWFFADQIIQQPELAISYPCLNCRGGLSIFLAYLTIAIEENPPGRTPEPILICPGTPEIREAYTKQRVQIGELLNMLRQRRVKARRQCFVHRWEENVLGALRRGRFRESTELPLHDFFPAAMLDESGLPRTFAGRDGLGRGDDTAPPLQFAPKIIRVSSQVRYRVAVIMHDAIESRTERRRVAKGLDAINAESLVHLFESPYSPTFQKMMALGKRCWRLQPEDFKSENSPIPADDEILRMLAAERRIHSVPSVMTPREHLSFAKNFRQLRELARETQEIAEAYSYLYNCYRLLITLPVPVEYYDIAANELGFSTLSERVEDVKEIAAALGPGVPYSLIDDSVQILWTLIDRIKTDPARARALLVETRGAWKDGKRLGIVVSSTIFASAIERYLASQLDCELLSLRDMEIHVIEMRSLVHLKPFDILLFFGFKGPGVLRWMMSGHAKEIVAILSEHERKVMARHLRMASRDYNSWRPRFKVSVNEGKDSGQSVFVEQFQQTLGDPEPELPEIPLEDDEFIRDILDYSPPIGTVSVRMTSGIIFRTCRRVSFKDRYVFLPADGSATILRRKGTSEKRIEDLEVGDVILFVNGDQRRSIYELMLSEIKKSPAFAVSASIIEAWHRRLKIEFSSSSLTIAAIHRKLKDAGSRVVSSTVGAWLRGSVMSPQDSENLGRLFLVLRIPNPEGKYSKRIDQAAQHLRKVYRQYARAVNSFLLQTAGDDRPELDALLEKYNLDIEAIREAVLALEVEGISSGKIEIPASRAGRLYEH